MQIMTREEVLLRDELDRTYARLLEAQAKAARQEPHPEAGETNLRRGDVAAGIWTRTG